MVDVPEPAAVVAASVERRIATVLFADLVGFTTLAERLDAEDMAGIQDAYFGAVRETVERYGGTLEKFIGDAAMAVFGAPRARDDDAERAVRAGLALVAAIEQLGARLGLEPRLLRLRVGVNTGEVVHATSGPDAGRVTGDTVNTAARLQTAAEPNRVLVGEITALAVDQAVELAEPIGIELKGKTDPVRAAEVIGIRPEPSRDAMLGSLRAPILGRAEELERLDAIRAGRVTVIAPPGVGKSRLVAELASRAEARGERVLRARVRPQSTTPYEAVAQLLIAAGARTALDPALATLPEPRRGMVEREVTALLEPVATKGTQSRDVTAERDVRFGAWSEALRALTAEQPATWIVEDVHWAGGDLLAFIAQAAAGDARIVCTARPSLADVAGEWVASAERLELATLPRAGAVELIRALIGDAIPPALAATVAERSDGNPLFIEELIRTWASVGTLVRDTHGWRLTVEPDTVVLPATVQAIYAAQLDDLPADARLVARRAAVAGRRFPDAALRPLELDDRRDGLETLRRRAFVAGPQPDPVSGDVYLYRHALLRDAGYASLARAERARLHAALARWLEETAAGRTADVARLIAEHYADAADSLPAIVGSDGGLSRAALTDAAAAWFERAAEAALAISAPVDAAHLLARALERTPSDTPVDAARRRLRRGEVLADSAALDEAIDEMTAARDAVEPLLPGSAPLFAEATYGLGLAYMQQIRFPEAEKLTITALGFLEGTDETAGRARLMALHAWSVAAQGRDEGAGDEARRARELSATLGDAGLEVDVLEHYAATTDELDEADPGVWDDLADRATAAGRWRQAALATRIRGITKADTDPRAGLAVEDDAAEIAESHGLTEQLGWIELARAEMSFVIGDWDTALEAGARALDLGERYAYERLAFRTWMVVLPILAVRGDDSWTDRYTEWWAVAEAHHPKTLSPYGRILNAATPLWLARARGAPIDGNVPVLDEIPPFSNPHVLAAREIVAEALIGAGHLDRAAAVAGGEPDPEWTPLMRASNALIGAWIADAAGDRDRAASLADVAISHARPLDAPWWLARALRAWGSDDEATVIEARLS
ncbi:MAG TPA: adenylate/guanylate cyclase domain-containing protein [Candidatus Limnocylindria bacterium]|nr:adenylate/guanylate cyclase domain-containing protein [Candidatus Limnocylindria bacterium]